MKRIKLPNKKVIIIAAVVLVLLIAALFVLKGCGGPTEQTASAMTTTKVAKGDVVVEITGSGTIEANEQYEITSLVTGDVLNDTFEEGDMLSEGDVMYTINTENMQNSIARQQNAHEKTLMSYNDTLEDIENLNVKAPISGTVTKVNVKKGDSVQNGTQLAQITDTSVMRLVIPFNSVDASSLYVGCPAEVVLDADSYQLNGTVSRVATGSVVSAGGVAVTNVEIEVKNPGSIKAGDTATAVANGVACNTEGTFEENDIQYIKAKVGGDVASLDISEGDSVTAGQTVARLESDSLETNLKNSRLSLSDSNLSLQNLYDQLDDYTITAPISGTVISKTTKAGDKLDNGANKTVMAIIADMSKIIFKISVDELDIAKLKVGQEVTVTADALEGKSFTGYVDYVSIVGTTSGGVTTYPVTVVVNEPEGLIPGMNVDARIVVQEARDVLTVPLSAIQRGNVVFVKDDGSKAEETDNKMPEGKNGGKMPEGMKSRNVAPDGYRAVRVEVGLTSSEFAEILSGLSEGDEVIYTETVASTQAGFMGMGGMPMGGTMGRPMGGGMPGGGMR